MSFLWEQLQQLGMVAIIMICAIVGTVGLLKIINKYRRASWRDDICCPNGSKRNSGFPQDPISKKLKEKGEHLND